MHCTLEDYLELPEITLASIQLRKLSGKSCLSKKRGPANQATACTRSHLHSKKLKNGNLTSQSRTNSPNRSLLLSKVMQCLVWQEIALWRMQAHPVKSNFIGSKITYTAILHTSPYKTKNRTLKKILLLKVWFSSEGQHEASRYLQHGIRLFLLHLAYYNKG